MKPRREPNFSKSADMRLVELQRESLGVPLPERVWQSAETEEEGDTPETPPKLESAVIACEASATPASGVIPGAIVTISVTVLNEGAAPAERVRVTVPLPGGASYRNGSFVQDGRPLLDDFAEKLFTIGILLPDVPPKTRHTFLWKVGVRIGNKPLVIAPHVTGKDTAVIGAEPVIVARKEGAQTTFSGEIARADPALAVPQRSETSELPFYELDSEETLEHEAAQAALSPIGQYEPVQRPPVEPVPAPAQPEPLPAPDQPAPVQEPGTPVTEPEIPPPPQQPPDVEPAAREAVVLSGRIDRPSVAYFDRIFTGTKAPTLLSHFILGGALACTNSSSGEDVAALKSHLNAQSQLLQRIVLHEKLGKKEPIAEYAGTLLAQVDRLVSEPVPRLTPDEDKNSLLLQTELDNPTIAVLQRMQEDRARWDFTKARQFTLALQARSVVSNAPSDFVERADAALRAYAQTATTQLQRFFVRMRIDRTTGLLYVQDETLDSAARTLVEALTALF